jgi:hypothetical protein
MDDQQQGTVRRTDERLGAVTITLKKEIVTDEITTNTVVCDEHGELVYTQIPRVAAQTAMAHRTKYPFCAPIKNAADS